MSKTFIEKILTSHSKVSLKAEDSGICDIDFLFSQDQTSDEVFNEILKLKKTISIPKKYACIIDHNSPSPDVIPSMIHSKMRDFSKKNKNIFFEGGCGISHQIIIEEGRVYPNALILGADKHTLTAGALGAGAFGVESRILAEVLVTGKYRVDVPHTYKILLKGKLPKGVFSKDIMFYLIKLLGKDGAKGKSIEFSGETIDRLSLDARFTITNMSESLGAKCALIAPDKKVINYIKKIGVKKYQLIYPDKDCYYEKIIEFDVSKLTPYISKPQIEDNVCSIDEVKNIKIDQAFLGTCSNGRLEDLKISADILKGKQIHKGVRFLVAPATHNIFLEALQKGIIKVLIEAGALILPPGCGPCVGSHQGIPADGDVVISTSNNNSKGIMGNDLSSVYLASPATVTASAIKGAISDPQKYF